MHRTDGDCLGCVFPDAVYLYCVIVLVAYDIYGLARWFVVLEWIETPC